MKLITEANCPETNYKSVASHSNESLVKSIERRRRLMNASRRLGLYNGSTLQCRPIGLRCGREDIIPLWAIHQDISRSLSKTWHYSSPGYNSTQTVQSKGNIEMHSEWYFHRSITGFHYYVAELVGKSKCTQLYSPISLSVQFHVRQSVGLASESFLSSAADGRVVYKVTNIC